jgi:hypothetical protein
MIHARRLHWSWALVALGVLVIVCAADSGALNDLPIVGILGALGALLAALSAAAASWRWQLAERGPGAWRSWGSDHRSAPGDVVRLAARRLRASRRDHGASWWPWHRRAAVAGSFLLGTTCDRRRAVTIPARHTLVVGATGAGKTVTLRSVLAQAMDRMGVVVVDGKGDPELERDLERLAHASGRRFTPWSPTHATRYSPFSHGADTEIVDKALAAENWGDDYYLRLGQRFLGFAVRALRAAALEPTLARLAHYVDPANLEQLAPAMEEASPGSWNELIASLPALERAERQAIAGTQHRLAALAESDVGALLEPAPGHELVDLLETVRHGEVAYFNLNADARPALSRMLGAAIVIDLVSVAATTQRRDEYMPTLVALDDVQAFASEPALAGIASLFARGRSAGLMLLLGTQSLADFTLPGARGSMEQLLDNRTTLIVHRLPGHASAGKASRELGEREGHRVSEHLEARAGGWRPVGTGTRSTVIEPSVAPVELMELETGVAVVKTAADAPRFVRVESPA